MKPSILFPLVIALSCPLVAATVNVEIGGESTGYLAMANVKNWGSESAASHPDNSIYPYFFDSGSGLWKSIAVGGLSSANDYSLVTGATVAGSGLTQPDFTTFSAGFLNYDNSSITGVGVETIPVSGITLNLNTGAGLNANASVFSPYGSAYNRGSGFGNFGWTYVMSTSALTGSGLTFTDGQLTSIDFTAALGVIVRFGNNAAFTFKEGGVDAVYSGTLAFSGNQYAFDLDVTKTVSSVLGTLTDTHMVFNRQGSIAAVVPEPSSALLIGGSAVLILLPRRRRAS